MCRPLSLPIFIPPVHLDGTTLEGGGQLLRLALCLSSLTQIPIHIINIRGNRGSFHSRGKGKVQGSPGGGLKAAHLAGVEWLAKATRAETEGMKIKSRELIFRPSFYITTPESTSNKTTYLESTVPLPTPGSIFLILQAILPYLLFTPSSIPFRVTIQGGTNVSKSPSYEYISQVLLPLLHSHLHIPPITTTLQKRGWTNGQPQMGSVSFDITPLSRGNTLPAFSFKNRGDLSKIHVSILAPDLAARNLIRDKVIAQILTHHPDLPEILVPVSEDSGHMKRLYLLLVAETSAGCLLGRDWLYDAKLKGKGALTDESVLDTLVSKVVADLEAELDKGGCVDEFMEDQLVVFQALAEGRSSVDSGDGGSLHTQTARWVASQISGVEFDSDGSCQGVGLRVGETYSDRFDEVNLAKSVENGIGTLEI